MGPDCSAPLRAAQLAPCGAGGGRVARQRCVDTHCGDRELRSRASRDPGAPARTAADRRNFDRRRLAPGAVPQPANIAPATRRHRRCAVPRRRGADHRRSAVHARVACLAAVGGRQPRPRRQRTLRVLGAGAHQPGLGLAHPGGQRRAGGEAVDHTARLPDVVPQGATAHGHLGWRSGQTGDRQRPTRAVTAALVRGVVRDRARHRCPVGGRRDCACAGRGQRTRGHHRAGARRAPAGGRAPDCADARHAAQLGRARGHLECAGRGPVVEPGIRAARRAAGSRVSRPR